MSLPIAFCCCRPVQGASAHCFIVFVHNIAFFIQLKEAQGAIARISEQLQQHLQAGSGNNNKTNAATGADHGGTNGDDGDDAAGAALGVDDTATLSLTPMAETSSPRVRTGTTTGEAGESSIKQKTARLTPPMPGEAAPCYVRVVPITATGRNDAEAFPVLFYKADTVATLKYRIEEEEGVPVELQVLWARGLADAAEHIVAGLAHEIAGAGKEAPVVLDDDLSLYKCGIKNGTELLLEVK